MKSMKWVMLGGALIIGFALTNVLQGAGKSKASGDLADPYLDPFAMSLAHRHSGPGMETAAEQGVTMAFEWPDGKPRAGEQSRLVMSVKDKGGNAVEQFDIVNEKLIHLVIVSADLQQFQHIHPEYKGGGKYELPVQFNTGGEYRLYADFQPSGMNELTRMSSVAVAGQSLPPGRLAASPERSADINGIHVEAAFDQELEARQALTLTYTFTDARSGEPLRDMELYLGAIGHVVAVDEGLNDYLHIHPLNWASSGPQAVFGVSFPRSGLYQMWGQFQREGQVIVVPFTVQVK
ncbi:hypothetical protein [Paenibacillus protaetiae]|uniref:YtkA-like domain-containing protein n=1 Tax=Paenibacillus protaetiae TaxID=2509456 RepID=A0A4P6F1J8_9BACL|nr:hypothetical protein [Paenibacillus protaetiae]QAY66917.1 hypothetical protein ET464_11440 [Paenibacillus protaetiae]